jgi:hypothetical protein
VTPVAVTFYGKGRFRVMTAAARFASLHFPHRDSPGIWAGYEEGTMAISTAKHFQVKGVAEGISGSKGNVLHGMAPGAVSLY